MSCFYFSRLFCAVTALAFVSGCKRQSSGMAANQKQDGTKLIEPASIIALRSDAITNVASAFGTPVADRGSGMYIPEYRLVPNGFALLSIYQGSNADVVESITMCWWTSRGTAVVCEYSLEGMRELDRAFELRRNTEPQSEPCAIGDILSLELGTSKNEVALLLNKPFVQADTSLRNLVYALDPEGWVELQFGDNDQLDSISLVWRWSK